MNYRMSDSAPAYALLILIIGTCLGAALVYALIRFI